jgi:anti-anti-sigma factor
MTIKPGWCRVDSTSEGVAVLELHGEHDLSTKEAVSSAFEALVAQDRDVVLDLGAATFVDSAVLHVIYEFAAQQSDAGRRLVLQVRAKAPMRRAVEIVGLLDALPWAEDREGALALLHDPGSTT